MPADPGHPEPALARREPVDRAAALAAGAPRVPRRAVVIAVLAAAALALGGTLLERVASSVGLNPSAGGTTTTTVTATATELHASTASLLDITGLAPAAASSFRLADQRDAPVSLRSLRGKVVVLTFFNANCADACPVIASEIRRADAVLGARRRNVVFVTINTDPLATAWDPLARAVTATGLSHLANWRFLTGPLHTLDPIWRRYGVTVDVYTKTGRVAHNDVMYFIDRAGRLRILATPVANEGPSGSFTLPRVLVARSGTGIATYATRLLGSGS